MGVGKGRPISKVYRSEDAGYSTPYMGWHPSKGKTHRPAIMMEVRRQARRMEN